MGIISTARRNFSPSRPICPHNPDRLLPTIEITGVDQKSPIRAPARMLLAPLAEGQLPLIGAILTNCKNIKNTIIHSGISNSIPFWTPSRGRIVLLFKGQTGHLKSININNKNIGVAAPVRNKSDLVPLRVPGWIDIDTVVIG